MCVTDVGVAITNLRVVCKIITCILAFTEMAIIFLEIVKLLLVGTLCVAGYANDAIMGACHRTILATGKNTRLLSYWTRTEHDFSLTCHSVLRATSD